MRRLLFIPLLLLPSLAHAQQKSKALELGVRVDNTVLFENAANPGYVTSYSRAGVAGGVMLVYRAPYFIRPFFDFAYANLARGGVEIPAGSWGSARVVGQSLVFWNICPGIAYDLWRFRIFVTLGLGSAIQTNHDKGTSDSSSQLAFMYQAGVSFAFVSMEHFRSRAEMRFVSAPGTNVDFFSIGLSIDTDLLR